MRNIIIHVLVLLFTAGITAQLLLPHFYRPNSKTIHKILRPTVHYQAPIQQQLTMSQKDAGKVGPMLNDIIPIDKDISIFSELTRSVDEVADRLADPEKSTTVLAPSDQAIEGSPRKPWEDESDAKEASAKGVDPEALYQGAAGDDRAANNLKNFVEVHIVGVSPWRKGVENKIATLEGKQVWWDEVDGVRRIYPDDIEVEKVKNIVPNGQIWVLKGIIKY